MKGLADLRLAVLGDKTVEVCQFIPRAHGREQDESRAT
jgi:hypothetical protein